ncbi:MAG TPA: alpha/beta hydrolase, partial [Acidimicrobiales bacterium]|nr:alpha/beta hydrolase [Acidimicrobiales bacterium]
MDGGWEALHVDDAGTGAPVLLVHGQPGLGTDWELVVEDLLGDHRVLTPDRPGYGRSQQAPVSMRENADLLADMLAARAAAPAVVVGHSYGGGIAILMAAHRPEVVR